MRSRCRSRMWLPSSVTNGASPFMRSAVVRPKTSMPTSVSSTRVFVVCQPKGITSSGSGNAPRVSTFLAASAITIMRSLAVATTFSCKCAPPPPLIRLRSASYSSAPSMVRSNHLASSRVTTSMPRLCASAAVLLDVGTPLILRPSFFTRSPRQRTIHAAVDPVPRPTRIPVSTKSLARLAETNLAFSMGDNSAGMAVLLIFAVAPSINRIGQRCERVLYTAFNKSAPRLVQALRL